MPATQSVVIFAHLLVTTIKKNFPFENLLYFITYDDENFVHKIKKMEIASKNLQNNYGCFRKVKFVEDGYNQIVYHSLRLAKKDLNYQYFDNLFTLSRFGKSIGFSCGGGTTKDRVFCRQRI